MLSDMIDQRGERISLCLGDSGREVRDKLLNMPDMQEVQDLVRCGMRLVNYFMDYIGKYNRCIVLVTNEGQERLDFTQMRYQARHDLRSSNCVTCHVAGYRKDDIWKRSSKLIERLQLEDIDELAAIGYQIFVWAMSRLQRKGTYLQVIDVVSGNVVINLKKEDWKIW